MFKKILVGVDPSAVSKKAVQVAIKLAKSSKAKLVFAAVDFQQMDSLEGALYWKIEKALSTALASAQKSAKAAKVSSDAVILEGVPADELLKLAKKLKADLVVVGNWDASGRGKAIARDSAGDIKNKLINEAACSVLVVR